MRITEKLFMAMKMCVPECLRIATKKRLGKDVVRDGKWLGWQMRKEYEKEISQCSRIVTSNMKSWVVQTADTKTRTNQIEKLQEKYHFTFESMLILQNPWEKAPLTCLLIFDTEELCCVRYTVQGRNKGCDFSYTTPSPEKKHQVPVFGLYANWTNRIQVELLFENGEKKQKEVSIIMKKLPDKLDRMITTVLTTEKADVPFWLVTGGFGGSTYAFDRYGEIRYYLSKMPRQYGIYPMPDGRFLFPERQINEPTFINPHANVMHDMDYLGRVRESYYVEGGIHHGCEEVPGTNGRYVLGAGSSLKNRMEDTIICFDREKGECVRIYDLGDVFPIEFQNRFDWAHLNQIYCCDSKTILISMRNRHTVAKMDLETGKILWVLAHPDLYKGTKLEDKVLKPLGEDFHYFYQQHAVEVVDTKREGEKRKETECEIMLFDNHCVTKTKAPWFDGKQESYVCFYRIDEEKRMVQTVKKFACALSPTRSNAWFNKKSRKVFAMAGAAGATDFNDEAQIQEWDYDTMLPKSCFYVREGFFKAYPFEIKDEQLSVPAQVSENCQKGELKVPIRIDGLPKVLEWKREMKEELDIAYMENLLLFRTLDHKLGKVYLEGETVWEKDFTRTVQKSEVFAAKTYYVAVSVKSLPAGKYQIYVQYDGEYYNVEKWFEVC